MSHQSQTFFKYDEATDVIINTINVTLTSEQTSFLRENKCELRTKLHKMFNLRFRTAFSKVQITRAIERLDLPIAKPTGKRKEPDLKNCYYLPKQKKWQAKIRVNKKTNILYVGTLKGAQKAVKEFREKVAR